MEPRAFYLVFIVLFGLVAFGFGSIIAFAAMSAKIEREEPEGSH